MADQKIGGGKIEIGVESTVQRDLQPVKKSLEDVKNQVKQTGDQINKSMTQSSQAVAKVTESTENLNKTQRRAVQTIERAVVRTTETRAGYLDWAAKTAGVERETEQLRQTLRQFEQQQMEAASAGAKFVQSLREQTETLGMTRKEMLEYQAAQLGVRDQAQPMIDRMFDTSGAYRAVEMSAKQTRQAMRLLPAQITDVVTSLASGMPIYLVAIQQGGQLRDSFGGFGNVLKGVAALINPFVVALGAMAAAGGLAYYSFQRTSKVVHDFERLAISSGNSIGVTSSNLIEMTRAVSDAVGTQAQAAEALKMIASSNALVGQSYADIAEAAIKWSEVTGESVEDVVDKFVRLASDPVDAMRELDQQMNFLTVSSYQQVAALIEQGNQAEASRVLIEALSNAIDERTPLMIEQTNGLARAWNDVSNSVKKAWDSFLGLATIEEQYDATIAQITALENKLIDLRNISSSDPESYLITGGLESELNRLRQLANQLAATAEARENAIKVAEQERIQKSLLIQADDIRLQNLSSEQIIIAAATKATNIYLEAIKDLNPELQLFKDLSAAFNLVMQNIVDTNTEVNKTTKSLKASTRDVNAEIMASIENYRFETDAMIMNNYERERANFLRDLENKGIIAGSIAWRKYMDAFDAAQQARMTQQSMVDSLAREKKLIEDRTKERLKAEEDFAKEAQRINDQIGQSLTDALMNGGMNAKDYLINMFKTLVLRPILQPIISGTLGAFGLGSAGAAIAGVQGGGMVGGGTDVLGLVGALKSGYDVLAGGFTAVGTAAAEFAASMQYGTALFSEQTAMLAAQEAGMATTVGTIGAAATVLAGVAAGLAAGSFISGQYSVFGDPIVATALGTAAGTAIGAFVGGPIGAAIGAFIGGAGGGLINRAFGQGPREVQAAGVTGTLSAGGANLQAFEQWSRSGGWFRSGSSGTDIRGLDPAMSAYFNQQAAAVGFGVATLAEQLGQSSDRIGEYSQSIRVSLLNLSDEEAQQRIAETFADFSNNLVDFLVPSIQYMTKEGETSTEALSRLATRLATVNSAFYTMGVELLDLSLNAGQAASNLVDLTGGIESFTQKTDFLYQNFYTQAERVATATSQAAVVFERMGVAMPTTRDGFRELFQVIAGSGSASLTAAMLNIAPVMNDVISYTEQLEEAERQLAETIKNERLGLEREILQVLGDTVELRERELMALDESNRAMQAQLWMIEDAESALDAAIIATDSAFAKLEEALSTQLSNTLAELEASFNSLSDSLNKQIATTEAARDVANESIADLGNIFRLLDQEINSLLQNTLVAETASQGLAFIAQALRTAQTTGYLPDREQLATAISAARGGLGSEQFGSSFEQRRATLVLANQLTQLRNITGDQMTTAERQLDIAEKQLAVLLERLQQAGEQYLADQQAAQDSFERQLEQAQNQINVLRDIDDSVFSVQQAIDFLALNISQERKSMIALQQQMIALQQDANQRAAAEAARIEAERIAELERQAAQQAALAEAQRKAQERADAEAAAAEADRLARETTAAQAAAAAKAEADRIAAAEAAKQKTIADYFLGDLFGGLDSTTNDANEDLYFNGNISENANGGYFGGGLSLVGEEGPELVNFARPSMIYTAGETAEILNGGGSTNAALANEVYQLRMENQAQIRAMVALQARMTRIIEQWDGDGLPTERYEGETA